MVVDADDVAKIPDADEALAAMEDQEVASLLDDSTAADLQEQEAAIVQDPGEEGQEETPGPRKRSASTKEHASRKSIRSCQRVRMSFPPSRTAALSFGGRPDITNEAALDVTGIEIGSFVLAEGRAPTGERAFFRAVVTALRGKFPPIVVRFLSTSDGETHPLCLPCPIVSYVMKSQLLLQ